MPAPDAVALLDAGAVASELPADLAAWAHAVGVAHRG